MPTVSFEFEAAPDMEDRLQRLAEARRLSPDALMREAIEQYVDREERQAGFRQDAAAAWNDYQVTGQHVTGEEADAWLACLEAGEDTDPPTPHS
ncbi:CopG family ribbon-helix-helix protein [Bradyrhizobium sp. HKCCYLS3077]|uniref:CopG family ribbon-helix-helix protein n=1 Tax=unclassified Bradyrhizobium TaxID=2631580 RepID=UPI003EC02C00